MRIGNLMLAGVMVGAAFAAHAGTQYVDALVWDTRDHPGLFPEQLPGAPAPDGWSQASFGVAFSGGGSRSATATLGQLRALVALGWYQRLRYVSSVSGGTWGSLPFTYLPAAYDDKVYLGPLVPPDQLKDSNFDGPAEGSAAWAISNARLVPAAIDALTSGEGDESYSAAVAHVFLDPFKLNDAHRGFAWSIEHARQIATRNALCYDTHGNDANQVPPRRPCAVNEAPGTVLRAEDFYVPRAGRPFHIVNGSLLAERSHFRFKLEDDSKFPLQVTPYYSGVPRAETYSFKSLDPPTSQLQVGGALVESFAFDTWPPLPVTGAVAGPTPAALYRAAWRRDRDRFTLRDVVGVTGAAPQQPTSALGFRNLGLPEFQHWGMGPLGQFVKRPFLHEFAYGDGGHVDNLGLGALLERGVRNIIVFANMPHSFDPGDEKLGWWPLKYSPLTDSIAAYFDEKGPDDDKNIDKEKPKHLMDGRNYLLTGVAEGRVRDCPDSKTERACALEDLRRAFTRKQVRGLPLVHCQAYKVKNDSVRFHMPTWNEPVHICWIHLDLDGSRQWLNSLSPNLSPRLIADLRHQKNDFKHFPNYATFFEDWRLHEPILLKSGQVAAMSQLTSWTVCDSAGQIASEFTQLNLPATDCPGIPRRR
jgi:hypothetical protein